VALAVGAWLGAQGLGPLGSAVAQQPAPPHLIPQSLQIEHEDTLERLTILTHRPGAVGAEARKALVLFKAHIARESEFILPPLTLLPELADGKVTPDMKWALAMSDRVKTEREQIFQQHTQITDAMNALAVAARAAHDKVAQEFAEAAVGDSLNDAELLEPMVLLIGDYLRAKLPPGQ
jgi:hypothetical protein